MGFQDLPKELHQELSKRGNQASRTPAAIKAWDKVNQIREERSQTSIYRLAKKYGVSRTTIYRILNTK